MKSTTKGLTGVLTLGAALAFSPMLFAQEGLMPPTAEPMNSEPAGHVEHPSAIQPSDSVLAQQAKTALTTDPMTSQSSIDVAAKDGIVLLSGKVDSAMTKQHAQQLVAEIEGVRSIRNEIKVKSY
jgi:hypothetical protein